MPLPAPAAVSGIAFRLPSPPEDEQAVQFDDRFRVVVDAKVAYPVDALSGMIRRAEFLDDKRGRLLAAPVATCRLRRFERRHHSLGQWCNCLEKDAPHRGKHTGVRQHVALHREPVLGQVTGPLDAVAAGERSGTSVSGYGPQLTYIPIVIVGKRLLEGRSRTEVESERREDTLAVPRDDSHRLRRNRPHTGTNPRRHRTDREVLRLDCAPYFAGRRVSRDDREAHVFTASSTSPTLTGRRTLSTFADGAQPSASARPMRRLSGPRI